MHFCVQLKARTFKTKLFSRRLITSRFNGTEYLYNFNPIVIASRSLDDTVYAMLLRADLHILFYATKCISVSKWPVSEVGQPFLESPETVTHLLVESRELQFLYRNTALQPVGVVSPEFIFARFACAIFRTWPRHSSRACQE